MDKLLATSKFSFFFRMFSLLSGIYVPIYTYFQTPFATCFNLDQSNFWLSGNGLNVCELKSRHQRGKITFRESEKLPIKPISPFPIHVLYSFRSWTWNQVIALSPLKMMFSIPKYSKFTSPISSTMKFVLFCLNLFKK